MKKIPAILFLLGLSTVAAGYGESPGIQVYHRDETVSISFCTAVSENLITKGSTLILVPSIEKGTDIAELTPIVIEGRRARLARLRHELASGNTPLANAIFTENGKTLEYRTEFPFEEWMVGAGLYISGIRSGCSSSTSIATEVLAHNILYVEPEPEPAPEPEPEPVLVTEIPKSTTADRISFDYPFVAHVEKYHGANADRLFGKNLSAAEQQELDAFIDSNREGSVMIFFRQGYRIIDPDFYGNNESLVKIISAIRHIESSPDSKIVKVVIAGFASPEGSKTVNDRLALNRAAALKDFIVERTSVTGDIVNIYNGSVDWRGLREMVVESEMDDREKVINIIDNIPVWEPGGGRLAELKKLEGGETYRYLYKTFFPKMRNAAYIKVYYDNTD